MTAYSIAIYINEMTTAKGRFVVLFLLGFKSTVATDIWVLLYLQHVSQRHPISQKAYTYYTFFSRPSASFSYKKKTKWPKFCKLELCASCNRGCTSLLIRVGSAWTRHQGRPPTRNELSFPRQKQPPPHGLNVGSNCWDNTQDF